MAYQMELSEQRRRDQIPDSLLLLEHPPVYTMGRRDSSADLLVSEKWIRAKGMELHKSDRGGKVTYHGPGQLVGYLIFKLKEPIPKLVWKIEEVILRVLSQLRLQGERDPQYPGIWIENRKVAALGLHIEKGITRHGFALNVNCDLSPFRFIHPCGIKGRDVTSLEKELGWRPPMNDVKGILLKELSVVFGTDVRVGEGPSHQPE